MLCACPVGTDLIMHEEPAPEKIRNDGAALGRVIEKSRSMLAHSVGGSADGPAPGDMTSAGSRRSARGPGRHVSLSAAPLDDAALRRLTSEQPGTICAGSTARNRALAYVHTVPDLVAVGMAIGPFSLATRLMADPISAGAMAGSGVEESESDEVRLLWQCIRIAEAAVL